MKAKLIAISNAAKCFVQSWWRPVTCMGIAGGMVVNGVIVPLQSHTPLDMTGFSLAIAACSTAFAVRAWEKTKGVA